MSSWLRHTSAGVTTGCRKSEVGKSIPVIFKYMSWKESATMQVKGGRHSVTRCLAKGPKSKTAWNAQDVVLSPWPCGQGRAPTVGVRVPGPPPHTHLSTPILLDTTHASLFWNGGGGSWWMAGWAQDGAAVPVPGLQGLRTGRGPCPPCLGTGTTPFQDSPQSTLR